MKTPFFLLPLCGTVLLLTPLEAWADRNPDFEDDALPILQMQPGLVQYVASHFDVKDTGKAKFPGTEESAPRPPFIFRARPRGEDGPYFLRLLIQPGPPNHILNVMDMNKVHPNEDVPTSSPETESVSPGGHPIAPQTLPPYHSSSTSSVKAPTAPAPTPTTEQPTTQPASEPTSDTPSGPIGGTSSSNLAPPPDPAPTR